MDIKDAIKTRHSVRQYKSDPVPDNIKDALQKEIEECNKESGLKIQTIYCNPDCFTGFLAHYGKFKNVQNYLSFYKGACNRVSTVKVIEENLEDFS